MPTAPNSAAPPPAQDAHVPVPCEAQLRCPCCQGEIQRVRRRLRDRLISLLWPVHRFRCLKATCGWEDNLRLSGRTPDASETAQRAWPVLDPSRLGPLP